MCCTDGFAGAEGPSGLELMARSGDRPTPLPGGFPLLESEGVVEVPRLLGQAR